MTFDLVYILHDHCYNMLIMLAAVTEGAFDHARHSQVQ